MPAKKETIDEQDVISWVLHALKIVIGDESIREEILMHYHPGLHRGNITKLRKIDSKNHKNHAFTFDAFVDFSQDDAIEKKNNEMRKYLSEIINMNGTIVFTATNVQRDEDDFETHFQTFIVDNDDKIVYAIDPAYDKTVVKTKKSKNILASGQGIYYAEVAHETVKPFFESHQYAFKLIPLSSPAQIAYDDVFCQSWSLYILNSVLEKDKDGIPIYKNIEEFQIPESQIEKYSVILEFYKKIFKGIPSLKKYLKTEYDGEINDAMVEDSPFLKVNPSKILLSMTKEDMQ